MKILEFRGHLTQFHVVSSPLKPPASARVFSHGPAQHGLHLLGKDPADRRCQPLRLFRHGNQVDVAAHQAAGPNRYTVMRAPHRHEIDIDPKVIVPEKVSCRQLPRWVMWCGIQGATTRASLAIRKDSEAVRAGVM